MKKKKKSISACKEAYTIQKENHQCVDAVISATTRKNDT